MQISKRATCVQRARPESGRFRRRSLLCLRAELRIQLDALERLIELEDQLVSHPDDTLDRVVAEKER